MLRFDQGALLLSAMVMAMLPAGVASAQEDPSASHWVSMNDPDSEPVKASGIGNLGLTATSEEFIDAVNAGDTVTLGC